MKIELGKQYIRRDGTISGILRSLESTEFPFADQLYSYNDSGRWSEDSQSGHDLIREYEPPIAGKAYVDVPKTPQDVLPANAIQHGGTHYKQVAIQPWDYIVANNLGFLEGNAIKYITRHKSKNGIEDLKKAIHYIEKLIEVETANQIPF